MIIVFSGCGNSFDIADKLGALLEEKSTIKLQGNILHSIADTSDGSRKDKLIEIYPGEKRIIWVLPVYSWGIPPVMVDFINRTEIDLPHGCEHHLVITCGDDIGLAHRQWRKIIKRRGWTDASTWSIQMPNTYVLMKGFDVDSKSLEKEKLTASLSQIGKIARGIADEDRGDHVVTGKWAWIKSKVIYPWFRRYAMSPKPFHNTDACTGCGVCARSCPMGNISMTAGNDSAKATPCWGDNCALCLRCYHICPFNAVAYGKATKGKGHYLNPNIALKAFRVHPTKNDSKSIISTKDAFH